MALGAGVYSINHFKTESLVELTWLPGTQGMTDQDFKEDLRASLQKPPFNIARNASSSICASLWVDPPPRSARGAMT